MSPRRLFRLYAALLRLYPSEHRAAWGQGMSATFQRRARELEDAGPIRRLRFVVKEFTNVLQTALRERIRSKTDLHPRFPRRHIVTSFLFDVHIAVRGWRREPITAIVIVITLALGIGASTAIFTIVNGVLLRPLPFPAAPRLVQVSELLEDGDRWPLSMPDFVDVREQVTALDAVSVHQGRSLTLTGLGEPERISGMAVSPGFFEMLGTPVGIGRSFAEGDEAEDAPPTVVLGHAFWRARFNGDPAVLGQLISIDGEAHTIIGVAPAGIAFGGEEPSLWLPFPITEDGLGNRGGHMYPVVGRLAEGTGLEAGRAELGGLVDRIAAEYPESHEGRGATLIPLQEEIVGEVDRPLLVLFGAVGMLLLIACTNVASIMLARADARASEAALCAALGASTGRLVRKLLAETLVLAVVGGAAGVVVAHFGVGAILDLLADNLPRTSTVGTDWRVLGFAVLTTVSTGLAIGVVPALRAARGDLYAPIKAGTSGQAAGRLGGHRALVVAEISLAVLLVLGAGLLGQSLVRLQGVERGFVAENAVAFRIGLPTSRYENVEAWRDFDARLRNELRQLPGVESAGGIGLLPFFASQTTGLSIAGQDETALEQVQFRNATPGLVEALGTRVLRGRSFTEGDVAGAPPVMIINATAARRLFGDENPIGRHVSTGWGHHPGEIEVVGVVEDVRLTGLREAAPAAMYWPFAQYGERNTMSYVVRTPGDPSRLLPLIRSAVGRLDPELPIYQVQLLTDRARSVVARERLTAWVFAGFAALALALGAVGIFGVMAYTVVRRRREIGVRVAIGAAPGRVSRTILQEAASLAGTGIVIGGFGALALARTFRDLLYETSPFDPATFAGVAALLIAVALFACYVPARRAARVDPMVVLRNQ